MFNVNMLPCCILSKSQTKTQTKTQKGSFFHFFYESNPEIKTCFEYFCLQKLLQNQSGYLQREEMMEILNEYNRVITFPPNIQKQIICDCEHVLQTFIGTKKDIINRLETTQKYWKECQKNILFASFTIKWIKENKNPRFEKWLIKMLKIFILGILPDIEKRKKGKELQELIYSHFYDVYNYKDVYQDFIV